VGYNMLKQRICANYTNMLQYDAMEELDANSKAECDQINLAHI